MKSILEVARENGYDKQTVYRCVKKYHIKTEMMQGILKLDDIAEKQVKQVLQEKQSEQSGASKSASKAHQDVHQEVPNNDFIDFLKKQIEEKDKQINTLTQTNLSLMKLLEEKNQLLIEQKEVAVTAEPNKRGFFSRFRK